ncbi:phospholipase D-like domain-containing protein [Steroidobacter cummioxidans]|uniref:phospholipase D-like domain-containing protein n=1 Tax=Steroidobacter cummioxidans TaxID=1803913 RepID=UPI0012903423|nr:phospholipase D family protein [Steroidobacter cummioxidans]
MSRISPSIPRSLAAIGAVLVLAYSASCAQLEPRPQLPEEAALAVADDTPLDRAAGAVEASRPGESAFRLVVEGTEAFVVRVQTARMAKRSIDVQSYIWHADLTGMYFANELLLAADRGVKVRVLLDDVDARRNNDAIAALSAHPNIEIRTFNPFASRRGTLSLVAEGLRSFSRVNRRMHNKSWIADNRIAIVGGRNVGDEYFSASEEVNFLDLDFAMVGPVVREASKSFDEYWNSASAYPMETLDPDKVSTEALNKLRPRLAAQAAQAENSSYVQALRSNDAIKRMLEGDWPMHWSRKYQFVADDPGKVQERDPKRSQVSAALVPMAEAAQLRLSIISPYFVPGEQGTAVLTSAAHHERSVRVLTNSLVANDVAAVHGGYSRYRKPLLEAGVQIWELKPLTGGAAGSRLQLFWIVRRELAHESTGGGRPLALCRQLQPRPTLGVVELRARRARRERRAGPAAGADLPETDRRRARVAGHAGGRQAVVERWRGTSHQRAGSIRWASLSSVVRAHVPARRAVVRVLISGSQTPPPNPPKVPCI